MKKSKTQMTKAELITALNESENKVKDLLQEVDALKKDRIALDTIVADVDVSLVITSLNARIKALESKVIELDSSRKIV